MSDQSDGEAKAIELTRGIHKLRLEVRSYATEHGEPATPADLATAGYVPASELEAVRLELESAVIVRDVACADLATERARAEEAERNVLAERTMAKTAERLLDEARAKLTAANARAGSLEHDLRGLVNNWNQHHGKSHHWETLIGRAEVTLSAAPQASTEQVKKCSHEMLTSGRSHSPVRCVTCGAKCNCGRERTVAHAESCPISDRGQVSTEQGAPPCHCWPYNSKGEVEHDKSCPSRPRHIQTSPIPQVAQASHDRWLAAYRHRPGVAGPPCGNPDCQGAHSSKPPEPLTAEALQAKLITALRATAPNANLLAPEAMLDEVADRLEGK